MARIPINLVTGELQAESLSVGIDLGTTHSLIARVTEGKPETIADVGRTSLVPSVVAFRPEGDVVVGDDALPYLTTAPERTFYSVKRLIGRSYAEAIPEQTFLAYQLHDAGADHMVSLAVDGQLVSPVEISAHILKELKSRAEHRLKTPVLQAVITVPAYFNDAQRQATRDAGQMAGLEVLRIINEPTAAALAYGLGQPGANQTIAVYDLGGGTFDVTLLQVEGGIFEVLATHGDTHLGGDDIDMALVHHWLPQLGLTPQDLGLNPPLLGQLRLLAEATKKELSCTAEHTLTVDLAGLGTHTLTMTRPALEQLIQPLLERTLAACRRALSDAGLQTQQISHIVMVGGSTRIPYIKQAVGQFFGRKPFDDLNPDEVVALGAAVQADILTRGRTDVLLLDVTPLSLGIETGGGLMDVLIHRNSKIPTRATRSYTTQVDGQVNIRISVYQGEREMAADNRRLAAFDLRGIPAMPTGLPKVEVTFLLDADGILRVSARELRSGVQQQIEVKPSYGLNDDEVEQMLMASVTHAREDINARMLAEARQTARQMVYTARGFVVKYKELLNEQEIAETLQLADALDGLVTAGGLEPLREATDALEAFTRPFAERVMDQAVHAALVGRKMQS